MVHWSPALGSVLSDIEVDHLQIEPGKRMLQVPSGIARVGQMYEIAYPVANSNQVVTVSTTRPETILGDVTRVRFPADALLLLFVLPCVLCRCKAWGYTIFYVSGLAAELEFFRKHQQELADPQSLNHTHHAPGCGWINVTPLCGDQRHLPNRIVLPPANC